ncbi:urea ABC transporter ATP-binding subunit UrtE [Paenibacillus roseipurpureus]|uniref:Urea ABC transporter ATP-binding subunit UrtE n=1 Tax=Paenibacillus roseopurpureus TaxID=2918901 RepID=A0AA96LQR8_9BACL|nr:urea ABC transporter ATP-binding subunit UrtE [Paenibacillus sp. MBLB1832]WNR45601.1 urea ABC transporter ATP-binding subunit UrtE [Paenibacillus sp. MBLB1832]
MLKLQGIEAGYGESMVVRNVNLEVRAGQIVCLMGRNGVGKSTLMKTIMGLIKPRSGSMHYRDSDITSESPYLRAKAGIGYVPQGREIFPQLTVEENLLLGLEAAPDRRKKLPESIFETFPVLHQMLHRKGGDLSGGQQQQLAIARALAPGPKLLLLDEPMEGIQPSIVMEIEAIIESIKRNREIAVLLVEQSLEFATSIADYYYVLDRGTIAAEGDTEQLSEELVRKHLTV